MWIYSNGARNNFIVYVPIICTNYTRGQSHRGQGLCWTFFSKVHLTTNCRMDEYSMAEEHLKYVFKGSLHYLCWLGVILGREQDSFVPTKTMWSILGKTWKKKILHADIMWKMASWKLLSVDPNKNLYIFYR